MTDEVDLLIVGSGPSAATTARMVAQNRPATTILMVEVGPAISDPPGIHIFDTPPREHERMHRASQGSQADVVTTLEAFIRSDPLVQHPGLELVDRDSAMPLASMGTNVGGMGSFWHGATPRPMDTERIPFFDETRWEHAITEAEALLLVGRRPYLGSPLAQRLHTVLETEFGSLLTPGHVIGPIGVAGLRRPEARWNAGLGVRDILAPLEALQPPAELEIRAETLCEAVLVRGDRVTGARLRDRRSGERYDVRARTAVIAGGSFRTPQLLWASGIRADAVGRHLMDHPRTIALVEIDPDRLGCALHPDDGQTAFTTVPFSDPGLPYFGAVGHTWEGDPAWAGTPQAGRYEGRAGFLNVDWTGRTWPDPGNRVVFSDRELDWWGMPAMSIEYRLSDAERAEFEAGAGFIDRIARHFGEYPPGGEPRRMPLGCHMHYQGTVRMGETDDGSSVCDPSSRVWGFRNLFVGGNGVIPTPTACNPTLTNVALAVLSSEAVAAGLD
jgi:choline dehydrogenase-like flavoprotein